MRFQWESDIEQTADKKMCNSHVPRYSISSSVMLPNSIGIVAVNELNSVEWIRQSEDDVRQNVMVLAAPLVIKLEPRQFVLGCRS
jgi:hypothetical protein